MASEFQKVLQTIIGNDNDMNENNNYIQLISNNS